MHELAGHPKGLQLFMILANCILPSPTPPHHLIHQYLTLSAYPKWSAHISNHYRYDICTFPKNIHIHTCIYNHTQQSNTHACGHATCTHTNTAHAHTQTRTHACKHAHTCKHVHAQAHAHACTHRATKTKQIMPELSTHQTAASPVPPPSPYKSIEIKTRMPSMYNKNQTK